MATGHSEACRDRVTTRVDAEDSVTLESGEEGLARLRREEKEPRALCRCAEGWSGVGSALLAWSLPQCQLWLKRPAFISIVTCPRQPSLDKKDIGEMLPVER